MKMFSRADRLEGKDSRPFGLPGAFILSLAAALILSFMWVGELRRVAAAPGWPTVDGRVMSSGVVFRGKRWERRDVLADVQYIVDGQKHELIAIKIAEDVAENEAIAILPPRGTVIKVWYDPSDPDRCSLVGAWSGTQSVQLLALIGCWSFVVTTFLILCWRLRKASQGVLHGAD